MGEASIQVTGLGKHYWIGTGGALNQTLRETLTGAFAWRGARAGRPSIWALRDVSFEIEQGEAVGIIGVNGSGKSTLLKVLSRITEPTEGSAVIRGRVGSLLEVGTGFHSELTGRENVFLNGAILGMRRAEIRSRFDEIVAFAEVERFIDTPVKRYSSGMYTRLAFAVAAHLDFEILLVDEVLAVGDAGFQRKCLGKMDEVTSQGRIVLLVSHNLSAIGMLTRYCLWLHEGRIVKQGATKEVVIAYAEDPFSAQGRADPGQRGHVDLSGAVCRRGVTKALTQEAVFLTARLIDAEGRTTDVFFEKQPFTLELTIACRDVVRDAEIICQVRSSDNYLIFTAMSGKRDLGLSPGVFRTSCVFSPNLLRSGWYRVFLFLASGVSVPQDMVLNGVAFQIVGDVEEGDNPRYTKDSTGVIRVDYRWTPFQPDGAHG